MIRNVRIQTKFEGKIQTFRTRDFMIYDIWEKDSIFMRLFANFFNYMTEILKIEDFRALLKINSKFQIIQNQNKVMSLLTNFA